MPNAQKKRDTSRVQKNKLPQREDNVSCTENEDSVDLRFQNDSEEALVEKEEFRGNKLPTKSHKVMNMAILA